MTVSGFEALTRASQLGATIGVIFMIVPVAYLLLDWQIWGGDATMELDRGPPRNNISPKCSSISAKRHFVKH